MERRRFLGAVLATFTAPAIVRASSLMPVRIPPTILWGDGLHDDTEALQALIDGRRRIFRAGSLTPLGDEAGAELDGGVYNISKTLVLGPGKRVIRGVGYPLPIIRWRNVIAPNFPMLRTDASHGRF